MRLAAAKTLCAGIALCAHSACANDAQQTGAASPDTTQAATPGSPAVAVDPTPSEGPTGSEPEAPTSAADAESRPTNPQTAAPNTSPASEATPSMGPVAPQPVPAAPEPVAPQPVPAPEATPQPVTPSPTGPATPPSAVSSARVFFSGHSLMDNPLPEDVELIATSLGADINWDQQNVIGSPIRARTVGSGGWQGYSTGKNRRSDGMNVIAELENPQRLGAGERYDTLVIQERHDITLVIFWERTAPLLHNFHERLLAGNSEARTLFSHSWFSLDLGDPTQWIEHETSAQRGWECVTERVRRTLLEDDLPGRIDNLPASGALVDLVQRAVADGVPGISGSTRAKMSAIFEDDVHLTRLGIYYIAAVKHAFIFGSSPVGATAPPSVPAATARVLQQIAWDYAQKYLAEFNRPTMPECREHFVNTLCGSFARLAGDGDGDDCRFQYSDTSEDNPFRDGSIPTAR